MEYFTKQERRMITAKIPKCKQCGNCLPLDWPYAICETCNGPSEKDIIATMVDALEYCMSECSCSTSEFASGPCESCVMGAAAIQKAKA